MGSVRRAGKKTQECCAGCGSTMVRFIRTENGPHWGRNGCLKCGHLGPWLKSPWSFERALAFTLPFGRHRGKSVGDLVASKEGVGYLKWLVENTSGNQATAAAIALGLRPADMEGNAS